MISKETLNDLFDYRDGVLYWRKSSTNRVKVDDPAGSVYSTGYLQTNIKGKRYLNHRLIFLMHHGYLPKMVDHRDGDKLNNRIENLREATASQNNTNAKMRIDNTSGVKGVYWAKQNKKWRVRIRANGKQKSFGLYDDLELAELVAIEARNKYHGDFANHGNGEAR